MADRRQIIKVAHSPDSDDIVQFLGITSNRIDTGGRQFQISSFHTAELNRLAQDGDYDVIAISAAAYPQIAQNYLILPHGASIGRNFGPVVAARQQIDPSVLASLRVGIPGETTTAAALLRLAAPGVKTIVVPISPFEAVFEALRRDEIDCAVLIHEGQILFEKFGLVPVLNLGRWWHERTGLPLALGLNVIRRSLGPRELGAVSDIIRGSIRLAVREREEIIDLLLSSARMNTAPADRTEIKRYLEMYANEDTLDLDADCRQGVVRLLAEIAPGCRAEFAP